MLEKFEIWHCDDEQPERDEMEALFAEVDGVLAELAKEHKFELEEKYRPEVELVSLASPFEWERELQKRKNRGPYAVIMDIELSAGMRGTDMIKKLLDSDTLPPKRIKCLSARATDSDLNTLTAREVTFHSKDPKQKRALVGELAALILRQVMEFAAIPLSESGISLHDDQFYLGDEALTQVNAGTEKKRLLRDIITNGSSVIEVDIKDDEALLERKRKNMNRLKQAIAEEGSLNARAVANCISGQKETSDKTRKFTVRFDEKGHVEYFGVPPDLTKD